MKAKAVSEKRGMDWILTGIGRRILTNMCVNEMTEECGKVCRRIGAQNAQIVICNYLRFRRFF